MALLFTGCSRFYCLSTEFYVAKTKKVDLLFELNFMSEACSHAPLSSQLAIRLRLRTFYPRSPQCSFLHK